ncbi:MAG: Hydrogenase expression/formation protein HypD [candidate division WS2 bacterium]|nr:Hydrogenase expression/formation protein HypD [Candidatus Lithacetigena glycinireducens]
MNLMAKYKDPSLFRYIIKNMSDLSVQPLTFMEFCGTHTQAIFKHSIRKLLPKNIKMLSGPGCPVCVTDQKEIDHSIALSHLQGVIIATFGDFLKVPGSDGSNLQKARAQGADIRVVYSPLDAIQIAQKNKEKKVIFLGIGFETTAPIVAASILKAVKENISNYYVFSMHKLTPPATKAILNLGEIKLDGILGPGHVSTIIGSLAWEFLPSIYNMPFAISGFEAIDILKGLESLLKQCIDKKPQVINTYSRSVKPEGNTRAINTMFEVFYEDVAHWRGLGAIPNSGLSIKSSYREFDAKHQFDIEIPDSKVLYSYGCQCHEVIRGLIEPPECRYYKNICTPDNPLGACMVSSEGACSAYYLYSYE